MKDTVSAVMGKQGRREALTEKRKMIVIGRILSKRESWGAWKSLE